MNSKTNFRRNKIRKIDSTQNCTGDEKCMINHVIRKLSEESYKNSYFAEKNTH